MTPLFLTLPPSPALAGWVARHQVIRLRFPAGQRAPIKPYWPRPACALAFYPRDREALVDGRGRETIKPRAALIGQPTELTRRAGGADFCVYQIEFEPGALRRLSGLSMAELTDQTLDAEAVFPDLRAVADRIAEASTAQAMVATAEAWLAPRVAACRRDPDGVDWAAARLIAGEAGSLDRLARRIDRAPRAFHRAFRHRLGVSPKLFARIARLDRLIRARNADPAADWLSLAIGAGYYDHQHMARDFRDLCGVGPSRFLAAEAAAPERRFGIAER
ncbi:helix-turn-helix domain-containing protein [Caulobacter segnis]|uniref:AraC family transcriptional regulator n=1 Tax=Caulobacter segnis TaxID=88688 RepID=A0A2W5VFA3_9CAUL|nr:helix-turn-helix domain-containing protein [Caulobacter segnis]PZR35286.1 MAG: AraC family transcriptional regulator [Caulobacter segnis]